MIWDFWDFDERRGIQELLAAKNERIDRLEAALQEVVATAWRASYGDTEIRAIARRALEAKP